MPVYDGSWTEWGAQRRRDARRDRPVSDVTIRLARPDDLPHIPAIALSGAETFARYGQPLGDASPPTLPEHWRGAARSRPACGSPRTTTGPVGFLAAEITDDALYVAEIDVVMERQRQGHGRRLMQAAIDCGAGRAASPASRWTTFRTIPWNAPFYASLGFVEVPQDALTPHLTAAIAG